MYTNELFYWRQIRPYLGLKMPNVIIVSKLEAPKGKLIRLKYIPNLLTSGTNLYLPFEIDGTTIYISNYR